MNGGDSTSSTDHLERCASAVSDLELVQGRPPTLEEIAGHLDWPRSRARAVISTLLSDEADALRELSAAEPSEASHTAKER